MDVLVFDLQWKIALSVLVHLFIAYILALPIGLEREIHGRTAGLRTFPLVAVASCSYTMTGVEFLSTTEAEARVIQALITGMGFIGGGAILKEKEGARVSGTATAASLWLAGAIGMSVALQMLEMAILLSAMTIVTLSISRFFKPLKDKK